MSYWYGLRIRFERSLCPSAPPGQRESCPPFHFKVCSGFVQISDTFRWSQEKQACWVGHLQQKARCHKVIWFVKESCYRKPIRLHFHPANMLRTPACKAGHGNQVLLSEELLAPIRSSLPSLLSNEISSMLCAI